MIEAINAGEAEKVQELLKQGANPRTLDYSGASALTLAGASGKAATVKALLSAIQLHPSSGNALADKASFDEALQNAVLMDRADVVQSFMGGGATQAQVGVALQYAASVGRVRAARVLIAHAAQTDIENALQTASFVDMWRGDAIQYPEVVQLLLTRKPSQASLDAALLREVPYGGTEVTDVLLKGGANPNARNEKGQSALLLAVSEPVYFVRDAVESLVKGGADPNVRDDAGNTPITVAATSSSGMTVELLLSHGGNRNARTPKGESLSDVIQRRIKSTRDAKETQMWSKALQALKASQSRATASTP